MSEKEIALMPLAARAKTVVCVRIIRAGQVLAEMSDTDLAVINVAKPGVPQDPESLEYLFSVSKEKDAEMVLLYSENVAKAIIRYIKDNKVSYVLTGIPQEGDSVTTRIWSKFTHITFFVVEHNGELREVLRPALSARTLVAAKQA